MYTTLVGNDGSDKIPVNESILPNVPAIRKAARKSAFDYVIQSYL